jgi:hypothetical protein
METRQTAPLQAQSVSHTEDNPAGEQDSRAPSDPRGLVKQAQRGILRNHDSLCFRGVLVGQQELMNCLHAISGPFEMT